MTRNVLVVDDLRVMPFEAIYARTLEDAFTLLASFDGYVDELWLDHDLGGDSTIMPLVDWLCEQAFHGNPFPVGPIFVHSDNSDGADQAVRALYRHGYNVRRKALGSAQR